MNIHQNSIESYREEKAKGNPGSYRRKIYDLLAEERIAMTDREIQKRLGVVEKSNIQPEITRLIKKGWLFEVGRIKCPYTGKTVRRSSVKQNEQELF